MSNLMNLRMLYDLKRITSEEYEQKLVERTADVLEIEREFKFVDFLGRGSYGYVISAFSPDYDNEIAVKFTRSEHTRDEEVNVWPTLEHENILPLFETNCLQYVTIFITPKMSKDLETALTEDDVQQNPKGLDVVKEWLRQVLAALDYVHSMKLCHMDVKGDNVLIDFDSTAKLCDFSFLQNAENAVMRCGAPLLYRPPALEKEIAINGFSFDMWCYGIMTLNTITQYFMLKDIKSIERKTFNWWKDVYPTLFKCLQLDNFQSLMSAAFPGCSLKDDDFKEALDFIYFLLRVDPSDRPSAREALNHAFLKKGDYVFEKPDGLWLNNVDESPNLIIFSQSSKVKNTVRRRKRKLHKYKHRYSSTSRLKPKKWIKYPKNQVNLMTSYDFDFYGDWSADSFEKSLKMENTVREQQVVSSTKDECRNDKYQKYNIDVNRDSDVRQRNESQNKDQLRVDINKAIKNNTNEDDVSSPHKQVHKKEHKNKKYGRIRKLCAWIQDKWRMLCICGAGSVSEI